MTNLSRLVIGLTLAMVFLGNVKPVQAQLESSSGYGYICEAKLLPRSFNPDGGNFGYVGIWIEGGPFCGSGVAQSGTIFSTGATSALSDPNWLYSGRSIQAYFNAASEAAVSGQKVYWVRCNDDKPFCIRFIAFRGDQYE